VSWLNSEQQPLVCPICGRSHPAADRFCAECAVPLVHAAGGPGAVSQPTERKIKPQYTEGEFVKIAYANNQSEAEFIQGLLLEEGIPSMMRRNGGFDVPDMLAAGPRDILVPESGAQVAREALTPEKAEPV
jgi:Putative prokaryotic signal transducing protein